MGQERRKGNGVRKAVFLPRLPRRRGGAACDGDAREERVNGVRSFTTPAKKWVQCRELCLAQRRLVTRRERRAAAPTQRAQRAASAAAHQLDAVIAQENRILRGPF